MNMKTIITVILTALIAFTLFPGAAYAAPTITAIKDVKIEQNSGAQERLIDFRNYIDSEYTSAEMFFSIQSQSNTNIIDCYLEDGRYFSCKAPKKDIVGMSTITLKAEDPEGKSDTTTFNVIIPVAKEEPDVRIYLENNLISMEKADSSNIRVTIDNSTNEKECYKVNAFTDNIEDRHEFNIETAEDKVCVNAHEKNSFSVTVTSLEDARTGEYDIAIRFTPENEYEHTIYKYARVDVTNKKDDISIERTSEYFVCREPYEQEIKVKISNNSEHYYKVDLSASHELLLPEFEFSNTTLRAGNEEEMNLTIHTNDSTELKEYTIPVFARSKAWEFQNDIKIRLVECEEDAFKLEVTPEKRTIETGETEEFLITLTSEIDEDQYVRLSAISDMKTELEKIKVFLPADSVKKARIFVTRDENDKTGLHKIKVYAWNDRETEEKTVKVDAKAEHNLKLIVENNNFDARVCSASEGQVFEATIENKGGYTEKVNLEIDNDNGTIQVLLSDERVTLKEGEKKTIYVFVNPTYETELGNYTITLKAKSSKEELSENLRFRVIETEDAIENIIQITGYPTEVNLVAGEQKTVKFTIKNPTNERMENLRLRVFGSDNGVPIFPVTIGNLEAGESTTVSRTIKAAENLADTTFYTTIEVRADGYVTTKNMKIKVTAKEQEQDNSEENGFLSGFTVFLGENGGITGISLLIILTALIIGVSLLHSNKEEGLSYYKEGWR